MLLVALLICVFLFLIIASQRRDELGFWLLGMSICNMVMMGGVIIYIAQTGGLAATEQTLLFLSPSIRRSLQHMPISMLHLGYAVALGRMFFPLCLFMVACNVSMLEFVRRNVRSMGMVVTVITILILAYYYPPIYRKLVFGRYWLLKIMVNVIMGWIVVCVASAIALLVQEYLATSFSMFRRTFSYLVLSAISLTTIYFLYASKDPAQIYNISISEYITMGSTSYISLPSSLRGWVILISATMFCVLLCSYGVIRYTKLEMDDNQETIQLHQKFDTVGMSVSVFVHGVKNQLLASQVLHKKLARELDSEQPNLEVIREQVQRLRGLHDGMVRHIEELYRTVKTNEISLVPLSGDQILEASTHRFLQRYPDAKLTIQNTESFVILADLPCISEAIYNLMTNAYEAAVCAGREKPKVIVTLYNERLWSVISVRDNGNGIDPSMTRKIYEPFYTSKNTSSNWGMGLFYVRKIVKSHLGHLKFQNHPGEGCEFYIMLPRYSGGSKERES